MHLDLFSNDLLYESHRRLSIIRCCTFHETKSVPEGNELIAFWASIYTKSLGSASPFLGYLIGAFIALYSSVFST